MTSCNLNLDKLRVRLGGAITRHHIMVVFSIARRSSDSVGRHLLSRSRPERQASLGPTLGLCATQHCDMISVFGFCYKHCSDTVTYRAGQASPWPSCKVHRDCTLPHRYNHGVAALSRNLTRDTVRPGPPPAGQCRVGLPRPVSSA